jgi:ATP phosphoribosyltransferase
MFQDQGGWSSPEAAPTLQGLELDRQIRWQRSFRELLKARDFENVHLPTVMPVDRFRSHIDGKNLLPPGPVFRDEAGVDWALRSDMTAFSAQFVRGRLSALPGAGEVLRIGYSGPVFSYSGTRQNGREPSDSSSHGLRHPFLESYEFGAEMVWRGSDTQASGPDNEMVDLMIEAARGFGYQELVLVMSDARILDGVEQWCGDQDGVGVDRHRIAEAMRVADHALLGSAPGLTEFIASLTESCGLLKAAAAVQARHSGVRAVVNPLLVRPQGFYSGLTFELYVKARAAKPGAVSLVRVGAGGRYDRLFTHYSEQLSAVGFKIGDPRVAGLGTHLALEGGGFEQNVTGAGGTELQTVGVGATNQGAVGQQSVPLRIAVPKGRLLGRVLNAFAALGIEPEVDPETTRKLVLGSACGRFEFLLVKNGDVPSYIERGVADLGIAGSDVLEELGSDVLRPVTFSFGQTDICLAGKPEDRQEVYRKVTLTVASKYGRLAGAALGKKGINCEVVPLQGSVELAGVLGLSDAIVDLVETGNTLKENGLVVFERLARTRVYLIASRGFYYLRKDTLQAWQAAWRQAGLLLRQENGGQADE